MSSSKKVNYPTLDLHGKRTAEVFDLVDRFLTQHSNKARVRIMPGKGTGKIKEELIKYLKLGGYPWEYEIMPSGNKNTGSLIIILD